MKRMRMLVVVALALVICLPGMALADFTSYTALGGTDNYPSDWANPGTPINLIQSYITAGTATFTGTAIAAPPDTGWGTGYNPPITSADFADWTGQKISNTFGQANYTGVGGTTQDAQWIYLYSGDVSAFEMDINFFNGTTFVGHEHIVATGGYGYGNWNQSYDETRYTPVPIPPSALLLGSGLLGLLGLGWRRRQTS